MKELNQFVQKHTLILIVPLAIIATVLFDWKTGLGVILGGIVGLVGFRMIQTMVQSLEEQESQKKGRRGYVLRYCFYGLCFAAGAYCSIPIVAMLVGFVCHKGTLIWYAWKEGRKYG